MVYSPRLKRILSLLLRLPDENYLPVDQIAASLKTSRRTIFRELENVNDLLAEDGLFMESRSKKGLRLSGDPAQKEALLEALSVEDISYINKEERRRLLAFELLRSQSVRKLVYYASMFQVSEATISHDIEALTPLFSKDGIHLIRSGKNRIELKGSEADRRRAMIRIVHDEMPELSTGQNENLQSGNLEAIFFGGSPEGIMSLLNQDILRRVLQVFERNAHELNLDRFSQPSYIGLILHLVIAIERILHHEGIQSGSDPFALISSEASFREAAEIASLMEVEFDIEIPKAEQAFIAMHLEGSKVNAARELSMQDQNLIRLQAIVDDFISGYDPQIQMQLRKDDQFLQGLLTHMEPALVRIKNHLPIYNPLLFQLKEQYGELFEATRQAADRIETLYALPISDEEAGFITMHVGASLERTALHASLRPVRIGVVCASGIGVSALLAARIEKKFGQDVKLQTLSLEDVRLQNTGLNELLLSTFPVELPGIETIQVSPLLTDQDIHRIQLRLETIERKELPAPASPGSYPRLLDHLEARIQAQKTVLAGMQTIPVRAPSSKNDLIFMAAASLNGSTKPLYQDLLKREKLGAVVAEDYGFALFHATSFAASQIQMLFLYPENGQTFDSVPGFESIRMVIAAILPEGATEEDRQTLSLLFAAFIERPGFLAACLSGNLVQIKEQICPLFQQNLFEAFEAF